MQATTLSKKSFSNLTVLTIGDGMLDRYFYGNIQRKSPEADVDIVDVCEQEDKLGGAANVALNIASLGAKSVLISMAGRDEDSQIYQKLLQQNEVIAKTLVAARPMTVKTRIYNQSEYVLRLDREKAEEIDELLSNELLQKIEDVLVDFQPDICILQDYNKGLFTKVNISQIIQLLKKYDVLIAVDPKRKNFFEYSNVDLFKPNAKEVADALDIQLDKSNKNQLKTAAIQLAEKIVFKNLLLTLSEFGAMSYTQENFEFVPAQKRAIVDVSGAGDTVIALAALLLAKQFSMKEILELTNLAGGLMVEQKGVNPLFMDDLLKALKK